MLYKNEDGNAARDMSPIAAIVRDLHAEMQLHRESLHRLIDRVQPVTVVSPVGKAGGPAPVSPRSGGSPMHNAIEDAVIELRSLTQRADELCQSIEL